MSTSKMGKWLCKNVVEKLKHIVIEKKLSFNFSRGCETSSSKLFVRKLLRMPIWLCVMAENESPLEAHISFCVTWEKSGQSRRYKRNIQTHKKREKSNFLIHDPTQKLRAASKMSSSQLSLPTKMNPSINFVCFVRISLRIKTRFRQRVAKMQQMEKRFHAN